MSRFALGPHLKLERERLGIPRPVLAAAFGVSDAELEESEAGQHVRLSPGLTSYGRAAACLLGVDDVYDPRVVSLRSDLYRLYDEDKKRWSETTGTTRARGDQR